MRHFKGWGIRALLLLVCTLLFAACGATTTGPSASHAAKAPPTPTPVPTMAPTPTTVPPATSETAILDVRPSSMSIVGHLDCSRNSTSYTCMAEVLALSSNQGSLSWFASTTIPGNIVFRPARGVLAPGQHILLSITIPLGDCTQGLFVFHGPANTHTISWAC
jgi:hypothetical protein